MKTPVYRANMLPLALNTALTALPDTHALVLSLMIYINVVMVHMPSGVHRIVQHVQLVTTVLVSMLQQKYDAVLVLMHLQAHIWDVLTARRDILVPELVLLFHLVV